MGTSPPVRLLHSLLTTAGRAEHQLGRLHVERKAEPALGDQLLGAAQVLDVAQARTVDAMVEVDDEVLDRDAAERLAEVIAAEKKKQT